MNVLVKCVDMAKKLRPGITSTNEIVSSLIDGLRRLDSQCSDRLGVTWRDCADDDLTPTSVETPKRELLSQILGLLHFVECVASLWQNAPPRSIDEVAHLMTMQPTASAQCDDDQRNYMVDMKLFAKFYHTYQTSCVHA